MLVLTPRVTTTNYWHLREPTTTHNLTEDLFTRNVHSKCLILFAIFASSIMWSEHELPHCLLWAKTIQHRLAHTTVEPLHNGHSGSALSGRCREVAVVRKVNLDTSTVSLIFNHYNLIVLGQRMPNISKKKDLTTTSNNFRYCEVPTNLHANILQVYQSLNDPRGKETPCVYMHTQQHFKKCFWIKNTRNILPVNYSNWLWECM